MERCEGVVLMLVSGYIFVIHSSVLSYPVKDDNKNMLLTDKTMFNNVVNWNKRSLKCFFKL